MKKYSYKLYMIIVSLIFVSSISLAQQEEMMNDKIFFDQKSLRGLVISLQGELLKYAPTVPSMTIDCLREAIEIIKICPSQGNVLKIKLEKKETDYDEHRRCKERAIEYCTMALKTYDPLAKNFYSVVYLIRGMTYLDIYEYEKVVADMSAVINLNCPLFKDNLSLCYSIRGFAYYVLEKFDKAIKDFDIAFKLDKKSAYFDVDLFHFFKGEACARLSEFDRAIESYDVVLNLKNKNPVLQISKIYYHKGLIYSYLGEYKKAIKNYNASLEIDDVYNLNFGCMTHIKRGEACLLMGNYKEAIDAFSQGVSIKHDNCLRLAKLQNMDLRYDAYSHRVKCYMNLKDYEKVLKDLNSMISLVQRG